MRNTIQFEVVSTLKLSINVGSMKQSMLILMTAIHLLRLYKRFLKKSDTIEITCLCHASET